MSAFLMGGWQLTEPIAPIFNPLFIIEKDHIVSRSLSGTIRMNLTWLPVEDDLYVIHMDNLTVQERPRDWYNVAKYSVFLRYYHKILRHGMRVRVRIVDDRMTMLHVEASIGNETLPRLLLEKA